MSTSKKTPFLGCKFSVVSAWGAANALTGISNANPAVVTDTAHGFVTGDPVKISGVVGMEEINGVIAVVEMIDANSYRLHGVDSTQYGTYVSGGSASKGTFTSTCEVTNYSGDSGTTDEITTETNCGKSTEPGATDPGSVSVDFQYANTAFQTAVSALQKSRETTVFKTVMKNGTDAFFDVGFITGVKRGGSAGGLWTSGFTLRRQMDRVDLVLA